MKQIFMTVLIFWLGVSGLSKGQILDAQKKVKDKKDGVSGFLDIDFERKLGNTDQYIASGETNTQYNHGSNVFLFLGRGKFGESQGVTIDQNHMEHLRYRRDLSEDIGWEVYLQYEENFFKRLVSRKLAGTGPRFVISQSEAFSLIFGTSIMYEEQTLSKGDYDDSGDKEEVYRSSNYVVLPLTLAKGIDFQLTTYYQPRIAHADDYRVSSVMAVVTEINKILSWKLAASVYEDSKPSDGVRRADSEFKSSLRFKF